MPVLVVGKTEIPYRVRYSRKVVRRHIVVTPGDVEVVVPAESEEDAVEEFVRQRRRWIFDKREEVEAKARQLEAASLSRFVTGAKIPFRGRQMGLTVLLGDEALARVVYRNGFYVTVPKTLTIAGRDELVGGALTQWLKERVTQDVAEMVRHFGKRLGVEPRGVRIKEQKHLWGSCGKDQVINLNWHLVFAPKPVLAYAVVHEMCHLACRDHSDVFWSLVRQALPDFEKSKRWLDDNGAVVAGNAWVSGQGDGGCS